MRGHFAYDPDLPADFYKPLLPNLLLCQRQASAMMVARSECCGAQPNTSPAFFGVGHQRWRIACPPRRVAGNHLTSGNTSHRVNYLTDRRAATGTEVNGNGVAFVEEVLERQHMRAGEIAHMNVVTHGSAVRRRIVCSKHRDIGSLTRSRVEYERNEMGLRIVILADLGRGIGAGGIEVTQPGRF